MTIKSYFCLSVALPICSKHVTM